jgi:hypothetical protein
MSGPPSFDASQILDSTIDVYARIGRVRLGREALRTPGAG